MKNIGNRIAEVSQYLQRLMEPDVITEVQEATERKDRSLLANICRKIEIPIIYIPIIISVVLSVSPQQKWPVPES